MWIADDIGACAAPFKVSASAATFAGNFCVKSGGSQQSSH